MSIQSIDITPDLYRTLEAELRRLSEDGNKWAAAWLRTLDALEEEAARISVLAAFIRELPHLYGQMETLGDRILGTIAEHHATKARPDASVPDTLGTLFAPLANEEEE